MEERKGKLRRQISGGKWVQIVAWKQEKDTEQEEGVELIGRRDDAVMEVIGRQMETIFLWEDDFLWSLTKTHLFRN